jgi:hypothetical protein
MRNRDIAQIRQDLQELSDIKEQLEDAISQFLADIATIEKELDKEYSLSHILGQTRSTLEGIDVDTLFDFVDELEAEIATLSYKEKRVTEANKISMFPKNLSPSFFRPAFKPTFSGDDNELFRP